MIVLLFGSKVLDQGCPDDLALLGGIIPYIDVTVGGNGKDAKDSRMEQKLIETNSGHC